MLSTSFAFVALLVCSVLCSGFIKNGLNHNDYRLPHSHASFLQLRGGAKKRPSIATMFKAFWLTLIDPNNAEDLKDPKGFRAKKSKSKSIKSKKGRKLSD